MIAEERRWADADDLSEQERELFDLLLGEDRADFDLVVTESIQRRDPAVEPPLSFAQQRLWFLHQLEPASPVYNMPSAVRLGGRLDRRALRQGLDEIVRRHEALRTSFPSVAGAPVQVIAPRLPVEMPVVDLRGLPPDERARETRQVIRLEAHRPFDLSRGPLVRALLMAVEEEEHVAMVTMHHVVSDGWSVGVLVREMGALYGAFADGRPSPLPELPVQYADFSLWQRRWLSGERLETQLAWWRQQLAGAPQRLDLAADRQRPPVPSFRGRTRSWLLPQDLRLAIDRLARAEGVTPFMVLLTAFDAWLLAYSGQDDVVVGSPIANRTRAEIEGLIGFFVNTLVLRTDLKGDPTFRDLLARVRDTALGAYDHQDLPFERLVDELQSERDISSNPLFQAMLQLENAPLPSLELPGLTFTPLEIDWETAKFDLYMEVWEEPTLPAKLEYSTDLFDAATIERMVRHFMALLEEAVRAPERRLSGIAPLGEAEQRQVLESRDRMDRQRPVPPAGPSGPVAYVAARNATEELLAGIWSSLLWVDRVGVHDSFFELGGHSLLATQLTSRLRTALGFEVPVLAIFKAPTIASLAALLTEMQGAGKEETGAIERAPRDGLLPLSHAQERLWFLDQLEPGSPVYNLPAAVRLRGRLDLTALARSLAGLIDRHETLRTVFVQVDGRPFQLIRPAGPYTLGPVDLSGLGPLAAAEAARLLAREAGRPFDLQHDPMLRTLLLRLGPEEHVLGATLHHIASDGWSIGVFIRELSALYGAFVAGLPSPLPALPIQYADFALWQRGWLTGAALADELAYWRERLQVPPPSLELPADRPRPPALSSRGGTVRVAAPAELVLHLQEIAHQQEGTLFMVLLAGFAALLARLTGQTDLAVGTPIAGRDRLETEGLIGFFVNTLVLRTDLSGDPGFAELTRRVREVTLGAYAHQHLPFEKLVTELQPERSLDRTPLFQVMLALQNFPSGPLTAPGMVLVPEPLEITTAKFELSLLLEATEAGLGGVAVYLRDLFTAGTVHRLLGHFVHLLDGAAAAPDTPLSALPLLSAAERHQLLVAWNDAGPRPEPAPVLDLIREQATRAPRAVAVICGDEELTYGELLDRAGRLAARLRAAGVGPETPVALCLERSVSLVAGLLGILASGAAYVPLDPELPRERLALMLEDCGAPILVTEERLAGLLPVQGVREIRLGRDEPPAGIGGPGSLPTPLPESLAYVIYTSGSTGRPKGVAVEHRQLAHYLRGVRERLDLPAGASYATVSTIAADLGNTMIFAALAAGGTLHVIPRDQAGDAVALAGSFARHAVDCVKLVPSHLSALLAGPHPAQVLPRRLLVLGGEACPWRLVERVRALAPTCRILNHYGPTETTVGVLTWEVEAEPTGARATGVPLGRPLPGTRVYVLDPRLSPLPVGVPGELLVGGPQVTRGYLGRPDLTAERFIPDPWSGSGERLYRTGDLARYRPDGRLEFLGRADDQIKLRGFRIEPGEIEAALRAHPRVREAVVLLREDTGAIAGSGGLRRLVAYLTAVPGEGPLETGELDTLLRRRLPEAMVPSAFLVLDRLPLNANGKLDRQALLRLPLEPRTGRPATPAAAPRTAAEAVLAQIWCEVLGRQEIGIDDNFFELGGDSILSIQVVSRAAQAGLRLTPRQLFERQTIAGLAAVAATASRIATEEPDDGPVPLTPIQHRFFAQDLPHPAHYNHALLLQGARRLEPAWLAAAATGLVERHGALRARFERPAGDRPTWRQVVAAAVTGSPFAQIDLSALPSHRQGPTLEEAAARRQASLDLAAPPLFQILLFTLGREEPDRVLLLAHHLVVDGVSWRILLADLETAYGRLAQGERPELPARTASFRRCAEALVEQARSAALEAEAGYWRERLSAPVPRLPRDHDTGPDIAAAAEQVTVTLEPEETRALLSAVPRAFRTRTDEVLLAALAEAMAAATGSRRLLVDLEGHGRDGLPEELDASRTVGWFTAVYPVLLDTGRAASPAAALTAIKEQLREIPAHGTGYGALRYLGRDQIRESLASLPRAEVVLNYLGQLDQAVAEGRLFRPASESPGPSRDGRQPRLYPLEINGGVSGGRLRLEWTYSANRYRRATVEGWAGRFAAALRRLIGLAGEGRGDAWTPADFPLARLDAATLERVVAAAGGEIEDLYPPTPVQQGMLFHTLQSPDSGVYVEQMSVGMETGLDEAAFERAWDRLILRHPALRTAFLWREVDPPLSLVRPQVRLPWERLDWCGLSAAEQEDRLRTWLAEDRRRGFDLSAAPLLRLALIRLDERRYRFVWTHHHLLLDGWSTSILLPELFTLYEAETSGGEAALPPLRPFRDYVEWLSRQDLTAAEAFFRRELAGVTAPTPLGLDRPPGAPGTGGGEPRSGTATLLLGSAATEALRGFARQNQLTANTLVEGAWALLLGRHGGEEDVVFGAVTSGRSAPLPGIGAIVGLFINTLPVRVRVAPDTPFTGFLRELQRSQAEIRQFEHAPLFQVQGWCDVPRDMPLFESLFVFENYPLDEQEWHRIGARLGATVEFQEQTHYPLTLVAAPTERDLELRLLYDTGRFDLPAIHRILAHLEGVLTALPANPTQPLAALPSLTPAERHQLLVEWQGVPTVEASSLERRFFQQAARDPGAPAVVHGEETLSYGELAARAQGLARFLRRLGVGPDTPVGICLERSPELVVGVLGILLAGGACVPLDPAYPRERLVFMLEDALAGVDAPVLLTQERLAPLFAASRAAVQVLAPDTGRGLSARPGETAAADPASLAYIIYTSGSTGRPKGVAMTRGALANLFAWQEAETGLDRPARTLQFASLSFDVSFQEILSTLRTGGALYLVDEATRRDTPALLDRLEREGIERLFLPFVALGQLAEVAQERGAGGCRLRDIITAGEQLQVTEAVAGWLARLPGCRLHNHYGPSETHVVTAATLSGRPADWPRLPPIGRPVAETTVYLLDRHLSPVAAGAPGELYLGGAQLARGYLGRPERTAEKFIPDPFGAAGARLYRTGDLARHRPDGDIDFLGRLDGQVKIRGFRVEPGEIEVFLARHPAVQEVMVTAQPEPDGRTKRLVAYVVPRAETGVDPGELRRFLAGELPEHMVPSAYVFLDSFPLTPSGKLDRRALPAPGPAGSRLRADAPRDPVEEMVADVWAALFGLPRIGIHDDFFALGGHSILAVQAISRIRTTAGVEVPVRTLFERPTVALFAEALAAELRAGGAPPPPVLEPASRERDLPLSFSQQRLWFLHQMEPSSSAYNLASVVRMEGRLEVAALAAALGEVVRRHESLRTTFGKTAEEPVQRITSPAHPPELPRIDLRGLPAPARDHAAAELARAAARRPFDLTRGPLLRFLLFVLGEEEHVLLATMHHIVSDAWSLGVLVRELGALYDAAVRCRPSPLPPLPIQYADFACWQRSWLSGEVLAAELAHWRGRLQGLPVLELPTDRPRPAVQTLRGASRPFTLPGPLRQELRALAGRHGATLFMVLLAGFDLLLHRYSGQDDLAVGTPVANRTRGETEGLIGFFVNSLVLRVDLSGDPTFQEAVGRAKQVALAAFSHQDLPFEKLVEELQPKRSLSHPPLYQVVLALQNVPSAPLSITGLTLTPLPLDSGTSKLDLTLAFMEEEDRLDGHLEYSTDLFEAATIERLLGHLRTLLAHVAADPGRRLAEISLLREEERAQLLTEWTDTARECPQVPLVHELFAQHARQRPAALAVASRLQRLTYGELEARSNRLAHHLRSLGVGPEVLVAICTDRTPERVVGIVATLKAGGGYVSLDPHYPRERLAFLLEDARAPVLLTQASFAGLLPECGARVICLDTDWETLSGREDAPPAGGAEPANLAYVVYTSGSTGRPKGVEIPHTGLMNLVRWHQDLYGVTPEDHGTQVASPAFDASIWELWPYLAGGASLHIPDEETRLSAAGMIRWWEEAGITLAYLMTPLAEGVLEQEMPPGLEHRVRALIIGGDRLHRRPAPGVGFRLMNHYGPAEYTVTSTVVEVPPEGTGQRLPTIGRPVDNTSIYVRGRRGELVPAGIPGELYVGGTGLARGYLRRPDLTAEKFLPHPWSEEPGARLYQTGDLVRYLPDGDLEFLGRLDHQVKIRGLRIELGEIESALAQHPGLREAVVLAREDRPGDKRLVAYAVPAGEPRPVVEELRGFLRRRLPDYMVPSAFVFLDALPLTPNGKVDRPALPVPETGPETAYVAPRGPLEQMLAGLWSEVLRVERVGREDNFFDLGGHSLLLVQLRDKLQARLQREITMLDMFQYTTLQAMAAHLSAPLAGAEASTADPGQAAELLQGRQRREQLRRRRQEKPA